MDCEEIRLNLLAYLDGEVGEDERATIEAHLAGCTDCAAELERLQALQADLWDAVPLSLEQLCLPDAAAERIRANLRHAQARQERSRAQERSRGVKDRPQRSWAQALGDLLRLFPARQPLALAKAAIPLLVALCFLVAGLVGRQPAPVRALETLVLAPQTLAPDTDAALRVIVRQAESATPVSNAEVRVVLQPIGEPEALLYSGRTGREGTTDIGFRVPQYVEDRLDADLVVTTASPLGESEIRQKIVIQRSLRLLLGSDKPLYQPGQTIHLRVLVLDAMLKLPAADRPVTFTVHDPGGKPLLNQVVLTSGYGIAATDYALAADAPLGAYRLAVELGDTRSERTVTVGRYERPRFRATLDASSPYYLAGEVVEAQVRARTFDERPLPGLNVSLRAYLHAPERTLLATMLGRTDDSGVYAVRLSLPTQIPAGGANLSLEASLTDAGGFREWAGRVVPLALEPLAVDVVPEGGRLRPGIENVVYMLVTRPDGAPAQARLDVDVGSSRYTRETDAYGLATLRLRPEPGAREVVVQIAATDAEGRTVRRVETLSADQGPAQVLLRLDRATYTVGDTIRAEVYAGQESLVYLDVVHRGSGQTLSTHVLAPDDGRATLDLDVSPQMAGTIELHAYQVLPDGTLARDARLAVVDAPAEVSVDLRTDKTSYQPGDEAQVTVETSVDGAPTQSALGIAIVDESVFALEERAPGFAKLFFLLEQQLLDAGAQPPGLALAELLDPTAVDALREAQDQAAQAAWARLPASELAVARSAPSEALAAAEALAVAEARIRARRQWLGWCLSIVLLILPWGQWAAVIARLRSAGWVATDARRTAWRRAAILIVGGNAVVLAPLTVLAILGLTLALGETLNRGLLAALSISWLAVLVVLGFQSWRRREDWTQIAVLLAIAHGLLGALLAHVAGRGGDPGPALALAVTLAFAATLLAWLFLAAGLWVERQRGAASLAAIVVLLAVALVVLAGRLDLASPFAQTIGDPQVYAGPAGWLIGCAPRTAIVEKAVQETVVVEREKVVKETVEVEKVVEVTKEVQVEKEITKVVEVEKMVTQIATDTPAAEAVLPTSAPAAGEPGAPAASPPPATKAAEAPVPATPVPPPPLLGQYIPETLYWAPEALTDTAGHLVIDVPLPGTPATWRLTVLASTLRGELGSAETVLPVLP